MGKDNTSEPKQLSIRITWDLRQKLQRVANANGRSLNSEIVRRLMHTLEMDNVSLNAHDHLYEKPVNVFEPGDDETDDKILNTLNTINQKLDYITSESYSRNSLVSLVNYLSRKLPNH